MISDDLVSKFFPSVLTSIFLLNAGMAQGAPPRLTPPEATDPLVTAPSPAPAVEWQFHGKAFADAYVFTQGPRAGEILQSNLSVWPELAAKFSDRWSAKAEVAGNLFFRSLRDPSHVTSQTSLREGAIFYQNRGFGLKLGQLILPWGKSDGINPTDYFTAKDYTFYNPDEEVRRRGELSLALNFTPHDGDSPWNFELVGQARFPQTRLIIPELTLPAGLALQADAPDGEYFRWRDMQIGGRVQYLGSGLDFSLSAFRGTSVFPLYRFNPAVPRIEAFQTSQSAVGGDLSFNWGESMTVRLESALLMPDNGRRDDPSFGLVEPWHWDTVAGVERAFGEAWRVTAQFFLRYHLFYQDPSTYSDGNPATTGIQRAVGRANALLLNFPSQTVPGSTIRIGWADPASAWASEIFLVGYFAQVAGYLWRPVVSYKPMDDFKIQIGADLYGGDPGQTLGALRDRSAAFGEARWFW